MHQMIAEAVFLLLFFSVALAELSEGQRNGGWNERLFTNKTLP